jgi:hypothetical protein
VNFSCEVIHTLAEMDPQAARTVTSTGKDVDVKFSVLEGPPHVETTPPFETKKPLKKLAAGVESELLNVVGSPLLEVLPGPWRARPQTEESPLGDDGMAVAPAAHARFAPGPKNVRLVRL